jgi:hypothetical protein
VVALLEAWAASKERQGNAKSVGERARFCLLTITIALAAWLRFISSTFHWH